MSEKGADRPVVTLSDDVVALRPWSRDDAGFMAEGSAAPAIRRHNGVLDRIGRLAGAPATALRFMQGNFVAAERMTFVDFVELESERHMRIVARPEFSEGDRALKQRSAP